MLHHGVNAHWSTVTAAVMQKLNLARIKKSKHQRECICVSATTQSSFSFFKFKLICQIRQVLKINAVPKEATFSFNPILHMTYYYW